MGIGAATRVRVRIRVTVGARVAAGGFRGGYPSGDVVPSKGTWGRQTAP